MVLLSVLVLCDVVLSPVVLALFEAIHVNEEATSAVKGMLTVAPLHMVAELALVILGAGFIVTVAVIEEPGQLLAVGVIV
jgi:hypothetical protein